MLVSIGWLTWVEVAESVDEALGQHLAEGCALAGGAAGLLRDVLRVEIVDVQVEVRNIQVPAYTSGFFALNVFR